MDRQKIIKIIKDYFYKNKQIIFLRNAIVLSVYDSENVKKIFSIDISDKICKIFNKKYRIEYGSRIINNYLQERVIYYVVYKNDIPIYYEYGSGSGNTYNFFGKKIYNPEITYLENNEIICVGGQREKNFLFDIKNFWWRLNLEKAKLLIKDNL